VRPSPDTTNWLPAAKRWNHPLDVRAGYLVLDALESNAATRRLVNAGAARATPPGLPTGPRRAPPRAGTANAQAVGERVCNGDNTRRTTDPTWSGHLRIVLIDAKVVAPLVHA
jgi:hypothetical protein